MPGLISTDQNAMRFLMTDDIYIFDETPSPEVKDDTGSSTPLSFRYLGENNKFFLIVIHDSQTEGISPAAAETILKITTAKGMELRDLALMNLNDHPGATFTQLRDFFSCSKLCLLGIDPQLLHLPAVTPNVPYDHLGVQILSSFSLPEMDGNTDKKRAFWNVMKNF